MTTMRMFLICPVRGVNPVTQADIVRKLEEKYEVHWPPRDTDQNDETGLRICRDNCRAICDADVVGIIWDGKSQGSLFDLGMAFALRKPLLVIDIPTRTEGKSFQNMMMAWHANDEVEH
jgi:nucleoside 2-deoxyribosyltransferase